MSEITRCGVVAVIGAPNVGKSSLINRLIGSEVSSVSVKPQTTRSSVAGVLTEGLSQLILVDTPGVQARHRHLLDREMTRNAARVLSGADLALFLVEGRGWRTTEERALEALVRAKVPAILCLTKADLHRDKRVLLHYLQDLGARHSFEEVFPISAQTGVNISELRAALLSRLPPGPFGYAPETETAHSLEFRIAEEVRCQLLTRLGQEVPHCTYVAVESLRDTPKGLHAEAVVYVSKPGLKPIVVGAKAEMIKEIGSAARLRLERLLGQPVVLKLWVKVHPDWYNDPATLHKLGIGG